MTWLLVLLSSSVRLSPHASPCLLTRVLSFCFFSPHLTFGSFVFFCGMWGGGHRAVSDSTHVSTNEPKPCFYTGHKYKPSAPEWTFKPDPVCLFSFSHDHFLRWQSFSELNSWVWNIIILFAVLKGFARVLSQSHIFCAILFLKPTTGCPSTCPSFSPAH